MKHLQFGKSRARSLRFPSIRVLPARWAILIVVVLAAGGLLAAAVRAYNNRSANTVSPPKPSSTSPVPQIGGAQSGIQFSRLALQPEADKFRRRLGQRFTRPGRERSTLVGTLTVGAQQLPVVIVRTQRQEGERVEIGLAGGAPSLITWAAAEGARSRGGAASGDERSMIERIALDSPEQFVLAQMRGASYYTIARMVEPAGVDDNYSGPIWDLVRIVEPERGAWSRPQNEWRIFYVNCLTGMIDKILYQEQGVTTTVEISAWASVAGEAKPSLIRWTREGVVVMQLSIAAVTYGPS